MEQFKVPRACIYINYMADLLRSKDHCVIHIQDVEDADASQPDCSFRRLRLMPRIL
ncbi:hypothetical protein [Cohnella kolymensis]|uniref:hypothetical protein n=1 Tax=Cohnella kolymensis TaxID=1590652 RepID=UPI000B1FA689|nr:hypothetical protein [Cohnella kolymensis]